MTIQNNNIITMRIVYTLRVTSSKDFLVRNGHSAWNRLTVTFMLSRGSHSCSNIPSNSGIIWVNIARAYYDQMLPARSRWDVRNSRSTWSRLACVCVDPKLPNSCRRSEGTVMVARTIIFLTNSSTFFYILDCLCLSPSFFFLFSLFLFSERLPISLERGFSKNSR